MKNYLSPLITVLLLIATCIPSCNTSSKQVNNETATVLPADTLFEPTGNAKLDSLLRIAAVAPQDTNLAILYYNIGLMYQDNDSEKGKEYYLKCYDLSELLDWNKGRYLYSDGFTLILRRMGLVDSSLVICKQFFEIAKKENDENWMAIINASIGNSYLLKQWYETALQYYMQALPYFEKENDTQKLGRVYMQMADTYRSLHLLDKAIEFGEKANSLLIDDPLIIVELAALYSDANDLEKAKSYYEKGIHLCEMQNNKYVLAFIYYQMAVNTLIDDLEEAEKYLIKMRETIENNLYFYNIYLMACGRLESLKGNFVQAENFILKALEKTDEEGASYIKKMCYMILSEVAIAQHKFNENMHYWIKRDSVEGSMSKETANHSSEEMAAKYETEKKELLITQQQQVIKNQNLQRWLLLGGIGVAVAILFLLWVMLRLRNRRNQALKDHNNLLAEMNATKDKFFSIISHDLKNPALALRDALQLLVDNADLWNADTIKRYYHQLLDTADDQVELLYNLLNWAQMQTGRMTYTPAPFDLAANLRHDLSLIRNMAEKKGVTLDVEIPTSAIITGDRHMIATVVRNLLTNAVKFTPAGGTVMLVIADALRNPPQQYTISITDTGVGMTDAQLRDLFHIDRKQSLRGTAGEQGTGLGLVVCKELLDKHGITLHIESQPRQGSRFWFTI